MPVAPGAPLAVRSCQAARLRPPQQRRHHRHDQTRPRRFLQRRRDDERLFARLQQPIKSQSESRRCKGYRFELT